MYLTGLKEPAKMGGGYEYGTVCAVSTSPFDGKPIYIVDFESKSLALTAESLIKVRRRAKRKKIDSKK